MKEKPILFRGPLVQAILEGRKTQTRRVIKPLVGAEKIEQPAPGRSFFTPDGMVSIRGMWQGRGGCEWFRKPRYQVGDKLWVRETWGGVFNNGEHILQWRDVDRQYRTQENCEGLFYRATGDDPDYTGCWVPSIFLPHWASRIKLEVTAVRAELLQDITEEDARAEGVDPLLVPIGDGYNPHTSGGWWASHREGFMELWDKINGDKHPWSRNLPVWVYTFKRVENENLL